MKRVLVICHLTLVICLSAFAQSNLTYELHVGTTGENALLADFPESYAGEKINIKVNVESLTFSELDFIFSNTQHPISNLQSYDSIYSYTDEIGTFWTLWRSNKEIKNRGQRVRVQNAYKTFEEYVRTNTAVAKRSTGWIWFVFAGLLLIAGIVYACVIIYQRRQEKHLTAVEQETLRRKRMGLRRHYGSQLYLWLLLLVLYAPIALIAVFSFTKSKILGNWTGFSFDLYVNLFTGKADAGLNSAIWYTVVIALIAAVVSTILGTLAAIGIYNMRARQRKMVSLLNSVPMINPDIITGISLFLLFVALGFSQGLATRRTWC